jgi:uncharacterized delta-60 repeat protein
MALLAVAGGVLFLACGETVGPRGSPEACDGGECDAAVSLPEGSIVDASIPSTDSSIPDSRAGEDARPLLPPLLPCGDGGLPGALDPGFGDGGLVYVKAAPGTGSAAYDVVIQPDGKVIVGGGVGNGINARFMMVRLTAAGRLDTGFGDGGIVETTIPVAGGSVVYALALTGDGRIVAGGNVYPDGGASELAIARYSPGGVLDSTFGDGGLVLPTLSPSESTYMKSMACLPDGKILVAGDIGNNPSRDYLIAKFNASGSLDTTFGAGGKVRVDIRTYDSVGAMVLQPDGKILAVGSSHSTTISALDAGVFGPEDPSAVRLNPDGSLDPSFGSGGKVVLALATDSYATSVALDSSGRIVLGGGIAAPGGDDFAVFRFTSAGALDSTFGTGGVVSTNFGASEWIAANGLYVQADGKYAMAGRSLASGFTALGGDALARCLPNGAPDPGFGGGGGVLAPNPLGFRVLSHAAAFSGDRATVVGVWDPHPLGTPPWMGVSRYCL